MQLMVYNPMPFELRVENMVRIASRLPLLHPRPLSLLSLGLLHCRWVLYHLSHQGSPRILEWVLSLLENLSRIPMSRIHPTD